MGTTTILWIALLGAIGGLAFILVLPFVMAGLIAWQALLKVSPVKSIGRVFANVKGFSLPFVEAYLSGKKRKEERKEKSKK
jgi:hypothetical protein